MWCSIDEDGQLLIFSQPDVGGTGKYRKGEKGCLRNGHINRDVCDGDLSFTFIRNFNTKSLYQLVLKSRRMDWKWNRRNKERKEPYFNLKFEEIM